MNNPIPYFIMCILTYIRPILEYGSSVWNPHSNYIWYNDLLEKVQRNVTNKPFSQCRTIAELALAYKIINHIIR